MEWIQSESTHLSEPANNLVVNVPFYYYAEVSFFRTQTSGADDAEPK